MELAQIAEWPVEDQVTFLVGRASREAIELEVAVRALLRAVPDAPVREEQNFSALVRQTRDLVRAALVDDPIVLRQAHVMFRRVCIAYQRRNRLIHDMLVTGFDDVVLQYRTVGGRVVAETGEPQYAERSVDHLRDVCLELIAGTWRVRGLTQYFVAPADRHLWANVINGEATVDWHGNSHWMGPVETVTIQPRPAR